LEVFVAGNSENPHPELEKTEVHGRIMRIFLMVNPIGSMVLVYMLTFGVY
jgi:hypothetical protein